MEGGSDECWQASFRDGTIHTEIYKHILIKGNRLKYLFWYSWHGMHVTCVKSLLKDWHELCISRLILFLETTSCTFIMVNPNFTVYLSGKPGFLMNSWSRLK